MEEAANSTVPPEILAEETYVPAVPNSVPPEHFINFKLAPWDHLLQCPYDRSHRILPYHMDQHLCRCRKNYIKNVEVNGAVVRFQVCPYNESHIIHEKELRYHVAQCSHRYELPDQKKDFLKFVPTLEPHPEVESSSFEDWEDDCNGRDRKDKAINYLDILQTKIKIQKSKSSKMNSAIRDWLQNS